MPVSFENYSHSFLLNGKHVFAPSEIGRTIGEDVKQRVEEAYAFDDFYYHLRAGGHVAALHSHRPNTAFCKIDIENFFYSVARNRVVRALRAVGVPRATHYGKWSCVKNPYVNPSYSLPYGFVQSPILSTLVLATSDVGSTLQRLAADVTVAVYVDDISLSSNDPKLLATRYDELLGSVERAGFRSNIKKCVAPSMNITIFNCDLRTGATAVRPERVAEFHEVPSTPESLAGFESYYATVERGNI